MNIAGTSRHGQMIEALQVAGLTQAEIGARLGVSARTIRNWADGSHEPPVMVLGALRGILDEIEQQLLASSAEEYAHGLLTLLLDAQNGRLSDHDLGRLLEAMGTALQAIGVAMRQRRG